jgi:leucyl-tRNA synthetase
MYVKAIVTVAVQVNGKFRDKIEVSVDIAEEGRAHCTHLRANILTYMHTYILTFAAVLEAALELPKIKKFLDGGAVQKTIYVPGKILNILV